MTQHSKEELMRQYEAAKQRLNVVTGEVARAKNALHELLIEEKLAEFSTMGGVIGKTKVVARNDHYTVRQGVYMVRGVGIARFHPLRAVYQLARIKQDGTMSHAPCSDTTSSVEIVG